MSNEAYLAIGFVVWIVLYSGLGCSIIATLILETLILALLKAIFGVKE